MEISRASYGIYPPTAQNAAATRTTPRVDAAPAQPAQTQTADSSTPASSDSSNHSADQKDANADNSPVKSFAYGALGFQHPEDEERYHDDYYTAGKWVAAAATVGGLISLLA